MNPHILIPGLALTLATALTALLAGLRLAQRQRRLRQQRNQQPQIYEVGSPEYNAQIVGAVRQLNERLAPDGRRIPERVAIEIIEQVTNQYGRKED